MNDRQFKILIHNLDHLDDSQINYLVENLHKRGWLQHLYDHWLARFQSIYDDTIEIHDLENAAQRIIAYMDGIVTAGFGDAPDKYFREIAGKFAAIGTQLELEVERFQVAYGGTVRLDISHLTKWKDAIKAMYSGVDPQKTQLHELVATSDISEVRKNFLDIRPQFKPGRKSRLTVGRLLANRYRQLESETGGAMTHAELTECLYMELFNKGDDHRTHEENKMFKHMNDKWDDKPDNMRKTLDRHEI